MLSHQIAQRVFTVVAEWCVPKIVRVARSLNEIGQMRLVFHDLENLSTFHGPLGDATTDLSAFEGMGQAGPKEVVRLNPHDLTLTLQPTQRTGMNNPVAVLRYGRASFMLQASR